MKATIEIPDDLYRQVKARSALSGQSVRDVTIGLYRTWLLEGTSPQTRPDAATPVAAADAWLTAWDRLWEQVDRAAGGSGTTRDALTADRR